MSTDHDAPTTRTVGPPMTPEHWQQVREILEEALERDPSARRRFIEQTCAGDPAVRRDVEALVELEAEADDFFARPLFDLHDRRLDSAPAGTRIGNYLVVRELGSGGMGRVYLGARADREFDHRVAIKVLKRGIDTDEVVGRFLRERQILASLEHPSIAHLFDGGRTEEGLPFFVAEYVDGVPIDEYCEARKLSVEDRLRLFCQVCDAVEFAHGSLVIHRDLKPANILITENGLPKLLDFGIAKMVSADGEDLHPTRTWLSFMTPEVASPEQVRGERIRTTSDVYSLGVLLYLLLTGSNPHTAAGDSRTAVERAILETKPQRPSQAAPPERARALRGDLDNIVLTAVRKEPERRYGSARELADDIRRYLADEPVKASGDAWSYRFSKLVRRHKLAAVSVITILSLIFAFTVVAVFLLGQTARERERAERVSTFLEDLLTLPAPGRSRGEDLTVREALDTGRERIFSGLEEEPELRAELMDTMARVYSSLGLYGDARDLFEQALAIRRRELGHRHLLVAETLHGLAGVLRELGETDASAEMLSEALAIQSDRRAEDHPEYLKGLNNLAILHEERGDYEQAQRLHEEILEVKRTLLAPSDPEIAVTLHNLAKIHYLQEDYGLAEARYRESMKVRENHHGRASPEVARTMNSLASVVEARGDLEEAERLFRQGLTIRRQIYPESHPEVAVSLSNLAMLLQGRGDLDSAEPMFREAISILDRFVPGDHPNRAVVMRNLAVLLIERGEAEEAEVLARQSVEILRQRLGPNHWRSADAEAVLGSSLSVQGRTDEAEPRLVEGFEKLRALQGDDSPYTRQALDHVVDHFDRTGDEERAERYRTLRSEAGTSSGR